MINSIRRSPVAGLLGTLALALVVACTSPAPASPTAASASQTTDLAALAAAAKAEGGVKYFTPTLDTGLQEMLQAFTDKYGVPVTLLQLTNAPLVERFYADLQRGEAPDVISISDPGTMQTLIDQKHIAPYETQAVHNDYPPALKTNLPYYVPQNLGFIVFLYNTNLVSAADAKKLTNWDTVFDPQWTDHFGMSDPNVVGGALNTEWISQEYLGAEQWTNQLKKLAQLHPKMYSSSGPVGSAVASGEVWVGWTADFTLDPMIAQGAPIAYGYLDPSPASTSAIALVAEGKHPNAGKLFLEWITGPEAQTLNAAKIGQAPANPKATDGRAVTRQSWFSPPKNVVTLKHPPTDAERTAFIEQFNKLVLGK
jgi:iron(III) transport system substrate-binding protein